MSNETNFDHRKIPKKTSTKIYYLKWYLKGARVEKFKIKTDFQFKMVERILGLYFTPQSTSFIKTIDLPNDALSGFFAANFTKLQPLSCFKEWPKSGSMNHSANRSMKFSKPNFPLSSKFWISTCTSKKILFNRLKNKPWVASQEANHFT